MTFRPVQMTSGRTSASRVWRMLSTVGGSWVQRISPAGSEAVRSQVEGSGSSGQPSASSSRQESGTLRAVVVSV